MRKSFTTCTEPAHPCDRHRCDSPSARPSRARRLALAVLLAVSCLLPTASLLLLPEPAAASPVGAPLSAPTVGADTDQDCWDDLSCARTRAGLSPSPSEDEPHFDCRVDGNGACGESVDVSLCSPVLGASALGCPAALPEPGNSTPTLSPCLYLPPAARLLCGAVQP